MKLIHQVPERSPSNRADIVPTQFPNPRRETRMQQVSSARTRPATSTSLLLATATSLAPLASATSTISASAATTSPPTRVLTIPFLRRGRRTINSIVDWTAAPTEAATRLGLGRKVPSVVISTAGRTSNLTGATKAPALTTVVTRRTIVPPPLFAPIAASPPVPITISPPTVTTRSTARVTPAIPTISSSPTTITGWATTVRASASPSSPIFSSAIHHIMWLPKARPHWRWHERPGRSRAIKAIRRGTHHRCHVRVACTPPRAITTI
mmetsp:Transcript_6332/g.14050  ORF Transcript_6332/g.14050 Transcript_6332/m.14050 type:complete len:267 (-) Transcript_6332:34-834(-)